MNAKSEKDAGLLSHETSDSDDDHIFGCSAWNRIGAEGLPDEEFRHVAHCYACQAFLKVWGYSAEELRQKWLDGAPEREAWVKFSADCRAWYETLPGKIYLAFGCPFWSRRARWLGIPRWEDYKPNSASKD